MEKFSDEVAFLVAQVGPLNGQRWALRNPIVLGRENTCDIVIPDRQVSRHHLRLTPTSQGVYLEDLNSKNGTHRNGEIVTGKVLLQDGDTIQVALVQQFVYLSSDATVPLEKVDAEMPAAILAEFSHQGSEMGGRLRLDKRSRRVWIAISHDQEQEIMPPLSASQFRLLEMLYNHPGRVVSRVDLALAVWGENQSLEISEQALDALVRRLRERISTIDPDHSYIVTVRGHGLRLDNPAL